MDHSRSKDLKQQLKALEQKHINLEVRNNRHQLDRILADDFFEIGSSGRMFGKKECLESGVALTEMTKYNYEIYPLAADVVLSTYYIRDHTRKRNTLRSSIWKQINGRWRLYFHQGTNTDMETDDITNSNREGV
ncbi:DUF4440 domain-containing protein [Virgibacillus sp. MSP4-1]|uniref:nuclear transport factor 2 family protein n=1 Tax=Virgibacillus sp. MSP4-1 TaxID=2700081 RepID=UPI00039E4652|nr:DUF4440 domain-containing protein [Virgibacillus sp. MSP4-1]QHS22397.1 DUF4440 domain-containing protein [Virgibacillus sp. MSP4-1]